MRWFALVFTSLWLAGCYWLGHLTLNYIQKGTP
jgi:hypothetical protein